MKDMQGIDPDWAWRPFEPTLEQPWDRFLAAHLYRRAGFGAEHHELESAVARTPAEVIDELISRNTESNDFRATGDALAESVVSGGDPKQLSAAWVYRLLFTPNQLLEKMTLFWHGHFATGADKVQDARMMWNQNQFLREHALGDFRELTQKISQDPAMLIYLDSTSNRKSHPNENFARELMELFCLGEGNYSERDVLELARCFTGWEIKNKRFRKNPYQHDGENKHILGQSGQFDGEDGVRVVLEQPQLEQFLARKWYRYFISDEPSPSAALLQPLADTFRQHNLQIAPTLKMLFKSNIFFSQHAIGRKIKSPAELIVGTLRCLQATTNTQVVAAGLQEIGQGLFFPPNVKGWDGGRAWINSSTLLGRANLFANIFENGATRFGGQSLSEYLKSNGARDVDEAIAYFEKCLLAMPLAATTRAELRQSVDSQPGDEEVKLRYLLRAFTSLPQCQLG